MKFSFYHKTKATSSKVTVGHPLVYIVELVSRFEQVVQGAETVDPNCTTLAAQTALYIGPKRGETASADAVVTR